MCLVWAHTPYPGHWLPSPNLALSHHSSNGSIPGLPTPQYRVGIPLQAGEGLGEITDNIRNDNDKKIYSSGQKFEQSRGVGQLCRAVFGTR